MKKKQELLLMVADGHGVDDDPKLFDEGVSLGCVETAIDEAMRVFSRREPE